MVFPVSSLTVQIVASFPRAGDANAAIITDIALGFNFLEEAIAMDLGEGFCGEARR